MTSTKIRNFYFQRSVEKLKKIKFLLSKFFYSSPIYGKLNFDEISSFKELIIPNLWNGDVEKIKIFLKDKSHNNSNLKNPFFFYYHSFDFLNDLKEINNEKLRIYGREKTSVWIKKNNSWKSRLWDDFILASRVCNWIQNYNLFFSTSDEEFKKKLFNSILKQAEHLVKNFSNQKRNSDLIRIIKALIYISIFISNKNYYYQIAIFNLKSELTNQILKDGCHFQRNPGIHIQVLKDLLDIRTVLNSAKKNVFFDLQNAIKNMSIAYRFFLHKDNSLANFNGANNIDEKEIKNIISEIPKPIKSPRELHEGGFQRVDVKDTILIADCGIPKNYDATYKAHSCSTAFELSYKKKKIIINSLPSLNENMNKATAAHSTLTLNNTNSYKILKNNHLSRVPDNLKVKRVERYGANIIEIENYGYKNQYDAIHKRLIYIDKEGLDIRGEDNIYCPMEIDFDIRFFLDMGLKTLVTNSGKNILLRLANNSGWKFSSSLDSLDIISNRNLNINKQPITNEHILLNGKTKELITVIKWAFKKY
ncbi:MAG: hypothetical protein CFH26_00406 [Alphaproteobacteria bacterium MarineAlpha6_Bin4]|nr:MAG: hypothetical protein CFH26_00406 [Alphaproteobacteria bacterium MarineAlpha6_Bin4]